MNEDFPKIEVKIAYCYPDIATYPIEFISFNKKLNKYECLMNDGKYFAGLPSLTSRGNVHKLILSSIESWVHKTIKGKNGCFGKLIYIPEEYEHMIENLDQRSSNFVKRQAHKFIMNHENAIVRDQSGNNINDNLASAYFEVIDESAIIRSGNKKNALISKYGSLFTELHTAEPSLFIDLCLALNIANVHLCPIEDLYNKTMDLLSINPDFVDSIYNNSQRALIGLINRALYVPIAGTKDVGIETKGEYYIFNNSAIAKTKEELLSYFNANPSALKALEHKMGVSTPREVNKLPDPIEVEPIQKNYTIGNSPNNISTVKLDNRKIITIKQLLYNKINAINKVIKKGTPLSDENIKAFEEYEKRFREEHEVDGKYKKVIDFELFRLCTNWNLLALVPNLGSGSPQTLELTVTAKSEQEETHGN